MIKAGKRNAVYLLHQEGMGLRQIARHLHMSVNTVKTIVEQKGYMPETIRKDKIRIDPELLARLYHECQGRVQRIHEKLIEEEGILIAYSTLTRIIREQGFGKEPTVRSQRVPGRGTGLSAVSMDYTAKLPCRCLSRPSSGH